jgi:hypothetical protein
VNNAIPVNGTGSFLIVETTCWAPALADSGDAS